MNYLLAKQASRLLREIATKIESGNCDMAEEEAVDLIQVISHISMSKDEACRYLNICRSKFDKYVSEHKLPKGRKIRGYNELRFYKDELDTAIKQMRE